MLYDLFTLNRRFHVTACLSLIFNGIPFLFLVTSKYGIPGTNIESWPSSLCVITSNSTFHFTRKLLKENYYYGRRKKKKNRLHISIANDTKSIRMGMRMRMKVRKKESTYAQKRFRLQTIGIMHTHWHTACFQHKHKLIHQHIHNLSYVIVPLLLLCIAAVDAVGWLFFYFAASSFFSVYLRIDNFMLYRKRATDREKRKKNDSSAIIIFFFFFGCWCWWCCCLTQMCHMNACGYSAMQWICTSRTRSLSIIRLLFSIRLKLGAFVQILWRMCMRLFVFFRFFSFLNLR